VASDVRVKICGITNLDDAAAAASFGADALGFIFWEKSPRHIKAEAAARIISELPPFITKVGVFVNETLDNIRRTVEIGLDCVQLHGDETVEFASLVREATGLNIIKAVRIKDARDIEGIERYRASAYLLDTFKPGARGGTGERFDWDIAIEAKGKGRIILSGGINPDNVSDAVEKVKPYAVDVGSGVELRPGKKDHEKIKSFIEKVKRI
jgi:phosphoribosylanthranilate isomerase